MFAIFILLTISMFIFPNLPQRHFKILYTILVIFIFLLLSGMFVVAPVAVQSLFPLKHMALIYGILLFSFVSLYE